MRESVYAMFLAYFFLISGAYFKNGLKALSKETQIFLAVMFISRYLHNFTPESLVFSS